ncbi:MAG: DUF1353 domain-containing protein [Verrucomicrobiota bacterium]
MNLMRLLPRITILYAILLFTNIIHAQMSYSGKVVVEWLEESGPDRKMKLLKTISFTDATGKVWTAPKGWVVDGASIPALFWNTVGPPFVGDYRRASVVHDYYCDTKSESWKNVHRMFYDACLAAGESKTRARLMYAAVFAGGPRWEMLPPEPESGYSRFWPFGRTTNIVQPVISYSPTPDAERFKESVSWIQDESLSLEELEARLQSENIFSVETPEVTAEGNPVR